MLRLDTVFTLIIFCNLICFPYLSKIIIRNLTPGWVTVGPGV